MFRSQAENELSAEFTSASRLSRTLAALLRIGFWASLIFATVLISGIILSAFVWPYWPLPADAVVSFHSPQIEIVSLSLWSKLGVAATFLVMFGPSIVALHYGQRVFTRFAKGEVFTLATIADIRSASLWMVAVAVAASLDQVIFNASVGLTTHGLSLNPKMMWFLPRDLVLAFTGGTLFSFNVGTLFFGLCIYIAAYVMAEARRIADDNASFV